MPNRPRTVVFDVVETLMSLEPLRPRLRDVGLAPDALELWFTRLLCDGMALTLVGDYQPFPVVAATALRTITRGRLDQGAVDHVLAGFSELPAHPDVAPAMQTLAEAGVSMVCLSNGAAEATNGFLDRAGLAGFVEQVISVAEVHRWKPPPVVYEHTLARIGRPAGEVALVAVHAFDCHGAKRVGLTTGWASRLEGHYGEIFTPADVTGTDLDEVAHGLLALAP
ncbi:MAG: haloacid dehalogenase type II [Pseudonocardiaceae bacterium]